MIAARLDEEIRKVCPIFGVSVGQETDRTTWKFQPNSATLAQVAAGQAVIDSFDPSYAADQAWLQN